MGNRKTNVNKTNKRKENMWDRGEVVRESKNKNRRRRNCSGWILGKSKSEVLMDQ